MSKRARIPVEVLDSVFGDLSDGAYFAAMEEFGHDADSLAGGRPMYPSTPRSRECPDCHREFGGKAALRQHRRDKHGKNPDGSPSRGQQAGGA